MKKDKITVGVDYQSAAQSGKSGVGYYTKGMVEALAKNHPEIDIYLHFYNFLNRKQLDLPNLPNVHFVKSIVLHPKIVNLLRRMSIEISFPFLLKRRCDAYFFPGYINHPVKRSAKVITTIHDLAFLEMPESVSTRNKKDLVKFIPKYISRSTSIATVSEHAKSRIKKLYPNAPKVFVTYSPPMHHLQLQYDSEKARFNIGNNYILFVGNLEPRKNLSRLLDAYQALQNDIQNKYPLVLVGGDGWNNQEIMKKIQTLRDSGLNVIITGYVSDNQLADLYKKASVFVFPSLYEGYGIPPLEAMSFNIPVVASDIDVFNEVYRDAAYYCDPNDSDSISKAIEVVLTDKKIRLDLQKNGKALLQTISWSKAADILYENLVA